MCDLYEKSGAAWQHLWDMSLSIFCPERRWDLCFHFFCCKHAFYWTICVCLAKTVFNYFNAPKKESTLAVILYTIDMDVTTQLNNIGLLVYSIAQVSLKVCSTHGLILLMLVRARIQVHWGGSRQHWIIFSNLGTVLSVEFILAHLVLRYPTAADQKLSPCRGEKCFA